MTILDTIGQAMDATLAAEELSGLITPPHEPGEWKAWDKVRALLVEAAKAAAEQGAIAATRCTNHYRAQGYRECGICRRWAPEAEMTEEVAGYSGKAESSNNHWYRCNQCKSE